MEMYETYHIKQHLEVFSRLKQPTVYYFLKELGFSENYIKNLRKNPESIVLNNSFATTRTKISTTDSLKILKNPNTATQTNLCDGNLEILFEDDDLLVVNKPAGLACTPTRSHYSMNLGGQICKYMLAKDQNFVLRILNRLDLETAGIVVVAKNPIVYNKVKIDKVYHALAVGNIYENITIDKPILTKTENGVNKLKREISPNGKAAITHVEVVKNYTNYCHIKLHLETGRTHQIRVHLASIGHALLGDKIYGKSDEKATHTMLLLKQIAIFKTSKTINLEVDFPKDWQQFLK